MNADYQNLLAQDLLAIVLVTLGILFSFTRVDQWWRERSYDMKGKTVLITGGSRGLGLVMARQLVDAGARLVICARDEAELERARTELEQRGGEVLTIPCDVTNQPQVEQMVHQVGDRFGVIEVLINNAGTDIIGPLDALTLEDYDDLMKLNFWAPLYTTYAVLPQMRRQWAGRIVNISSIGGKVVFPHMVAYCASKFALTGLSEGMRTELAREGISVTTVFPGFIRTGVQDHVILKGQHQKEFTWFSLSDSLPLISTSAEHVARRVITGLRRGDAEVIVPISAHLSAKLYALFPGVTTALLSWVNQLLPSSGGDGRDRARGQDSHSFWAPSWLTYLSNRAARRNNELGTLRTDRGGTSTQAEPERTNGHGVDSEPSEAAIEDAQSAFPLVDVSQAPSDVQTCLTEIQDTLGIPWAPANWRAYAMHPGVMQLFWERLKPATQTEHFLESAIAISEHVYRDIGNWYQPGYQIEVSEAHHHQIQRDLNAFIFGNPQLLIQQVVLSRALAGEVVGQEGQGEDTRRGANTHRHHQIHLIEEQSAQDISDEMQRVYRDIKQTLDVPLVNSDYQALARWSAFFLAAWEDIKQWRERPEYQTLKQDVLRRADEAASHLQPTVVIGEREIRDRLDNPEDFEQIQQMVQIFQNVLPELIIQDALFHRGLANLRPVTPL